EEQVVHAIRNPGGLPVWISFGSPQPFSYVPWNPVLEQHPILGLLHSIGSIDYTSVFAANVKVAGDLSQINHILKARDVEKRCMDVSVSLVFRISAGQFIDGNS